MTMPSSAHPLLHQGLGSARPLPKCYYARFVPECTLYSIILRTIISDEDNNAIDNDIGELITPESFAFRMVIISLYEYVNIKTPFHLLSLYFKAIIHHKFKILANFEAPRWLRPWDQIAEFRKYTNYTCTWRTL